MIKALFLLIFLWSISTPALAEEPAACDPPYDPSNIIEVLFFYPGTINYLAHGPEACRHRFAEGVKKVVRETSLLTDGCIEATLKDVNNALAGMYKGKPVPAPSDELPDPNIPDYDPAVEHSKGLSSSD